MVGFIVSGGGVRRRGRTAVVCCGEKRVAFAVSDRVGEFLGRVKGGNALVGLERADAGWGRLKRLGKEEEKGKERKKVVVERKGMKFEGEVDFDVVVCGGTLGIFLAVALKKKGFEVAVVERGLLAGRDQEWNVSRKELEELVRMGLMTEGGLEEAIVTEFNPARVSFKGMKALEVKDVLNCGVNPRILLAAVKKRFVNELGGVLLEGHDFDSAIVAEDGVEMTLKLREASSGALGAGGAGVVGAVTSSTKKIRTRLLVDAMGNFSPIVAQFRQGQIPDGVCLVVGSCARANWPDNHTGDLLYSFTPIEEKLQYFWEAFPSASKGKSSDLRTTYMFSYLDADEQRPSLTEFYDAYLKWLPEYQGVSLAEIEPIRALFGAFPTYRDSPLQSKVDRVLLFGDSSGVQSPLSFGGLGAMLRHLDRIVDATSDALNYDQLSKEALGWVMPYLPSLSVTWLFQRAMSVKLQQTVYDPDLINNVLSCNFSAMNRMGDKVLRPFLQDVVQFNGLTRAMVGMMLADPALVLKVMAHVGPLPVADWMRHYLALGAYDTANRILPAFSKTNTTDKKKEYYRKRLLETLKYGSGQDYH